VVVKGAGACFELPSAVPLPGPRVRKAFENVIVRYLDGVALDNDVDSSVPLIATCRQNDVWVSAQVKRLLFSGTGAEVDRAVEPNGDERSNVWSSIGPDRRDPKLTLLLRSVDGSPAIPWRLRPGR
jgi:hypothetical protein